METRLNLGKIPHCWKMAEREGGTRLKSFALILEEVSVDFAKATPEELIIEAGDPDKNALALQTRDYTPLDRCIALYLVGPISGHPVKIGIADNFKARLSSLQTGSWEKLTVHALLWALGGDAYATEQAVLKKAKAEGVHASGEWLNLTPTSAADLLIEEARRINARLFTSAMMIENQGRAMLELDRRRAEHKRAA